MSLSVICFIYAGRRFGRAVLKERDFLRDGDY